MLPKGFPRSGTPPKGIDHGYMARDYQLPTRAIGRGLWPLQQCGHYQPPHWLFQLVLVGIEGH